MKKLFLVALAACIIQRALATEDPNPSIIKSFNDVFPSAQSVKWAVTTEFHVVSFVVKDIRYRIHYSNCDGKVIRYWAYYDATGVPRNLLLRLKSVEPKATPYCASEFMEGDKFRYQVSFLDKSKIRTYEVDEFGAITLISRITMVGDDLTSKF